MKFTRIDGNFTFFQWKPDHIKMKISTYSEFKILENLYILRLYNYIIYFITYYGGENLETEGVFGS